MRRAAYKFGVIAAILAALWISGCSSSSDPIDEIGYRYYISYADVQDRDESTTDIDVFHSCDNIYEEPDDDGEDLLTKASMDLTIDSDEDTEEDIWLYRVVIQFDLISATGPYASEPAIPTISYNRSALIAGTGGSTTQSFDLLTAEVKANYRDLIGEDANGIQVRATFQVTVTAYLTFTPDDPDDDVASDYSFTINVQNWAHSSCSEEEEE